MRKLSKPMHHSWAAGLVSALLVAGVGYFLLLTRAGVGLERLSFDLLSFARGPVPVEDAVIVYMDDVSYDRLGQRHDTLWDRALHAQLIGRLQRAGARVIVFDIIFSEASRERPEADEQLAEAMRQHGGVVLGVDHVSDGLRAKRLVPPFELLLDSAAHVGSVELDPSKDLIVRRHTPLDELIPTLGWAAAQLMEAPVTTQPEAQKVARWMNYYGPPNYLPWVSYHEALDPVKVADSYFSNRVVFVGDRRMTKYAGERKDEYRNPYSYWMTESMIKALGTPFISGVEIQATAFLNYWRGDWLERTARETEILWITVLGAGLGFWLLRVRPVISVLLAGAGVALALAAAYTVYVKQSVWFPWLIVVVLIGLALAFALAFNSVQLYIQKRLYEHTLGLYLSPKLVKRFSRDTNFLKPGGEEQTLSIMFTDIANFTDNTQEMDSDTLARLMNEYFHVAVSECIHVHDGTVVKYIGDAVFAFWNAPELQSDHALRCCQAALRLIDKSFSWPQGGTLVTRIGVHTGPARVGNFGSEDRVDYTALGESVNLASRLEGLNKFLGTSCLISFQTQREIEGHLVTRRIGTFQLKGFDKAIDVYELLGGQESKETTRSWRERFEEALRCFEAGEFELAAMGFREVLAERPEDGPAQYYLKRLSVIGDQEAPEGWDGRTQMWEK